MCAYKLEYGYFLYTFTYVCFNVPNLLLIIVILLILDIILNVFSEKTEVFLHFVRFNPLLHKLFLDYDIIFYF